MPDRRAHRGPHPEDARLFAAEIHATLRRATGDLCWLLSRGYAHESSLKLVGDRYGLLARQRIAVARCACSDKAARGRRSRQILPGSAGISPAESGRDARAPSSLWIDGYNVLTTVEAALGGGVLLLACDGTYRDMASMHGSYRKVAETLPALELLGRTIAALGDCPNFRGDCPNFRPSENGTVPLETKTATIPCVWYLDRPVSNSGRLKGIVERLAAERGWRWRVELVDDPDAVLIAACAARIPPAPGCVDERPLDVVVATADSVILDGCRAWFNLARETVERHVAEANVVDLQALGGTECL